MPRRVLLAVSLCLLCTCSEATTPEPQTESVLFKLELWGTFETDGGSQVRRVLEDRQVMKSGASITMTLQKVDEGRIYLVHQDPKGSLAVLYPGKEQRHQPADTVRLLDHASLDDQTGIERIYMIASAQPLRTLDKAIAAWHEADPRAAEAVLEAVHSLRNQYETMESEPPRPSPIGGRSRGETLGLEYSVRGVRCRTFTIDHR